MLDMSCLPRACWPRDRQPRVCQPGEHRARPEPARVGAWLLLALAPGAFGCGDEALARRSVSALSSRSAGELPTAAGLDAVGEAAAVFADEHDVPGLAVALVDDGELVWAEGLGVTSVVTGAPVTADTPFMLASVSKTVVGAALAQAHVAGALDLDETVERTTGWPLRNPRVSDGAFTLRHLATHTAGVRDNWDVLAGTYTRGDSPIPLEELVAAYFLPGGDWYDEEANFHSSPPGEERRYSNLGTALAGWALEPATGRSLDLWSQEELFEPLGMRRSGWFLADHDPELVAVPHGDAGDGEHFAYGHYGYPDWPDGQLRSSAWDMGLYLAALARPGGGLSEAVRHELLLVPFPDAHDGQALFWRRRQRAGRTVWGHSGDDAGVATEVLFDPETGDGVVVLMNVDWTDARKQGLRELQALALTALDLAL